MKTKKWRRFGVVTLFIVILGVQTSALANPSPLPETLKCIYDFSTSADYKDGKWETEKNKGFSFIFINIK